MSSSSSSFCAHVTTENAVKMMYFIKVNSTSPLQPRQVIRQTTLVPQLLLPKAALKLQVNFVCFQAFLDVEQDINLTQGQSVCQCPRLHWKTSENMSLFCGAYRWVSIYSDRWPNEYYVYYIVYIWCDISLSSQFVEQMLKICLVNTDCRIGFQNLRKIIGCIVSPEWPAAVGNFPEMYNYLWVHLQWLQWMQCSSLQAPRSSLPPTGGVTTVSLNTVGTQKWPLWTSRAQSDNKGYRQYGCDFSEPGKEFWNERAHQVGTGEVPEEWDTLNHKQTP